MTSISEFIHEIDAGALSDHRRRRILLAATRVIGAVGLSAAACPFVASLEPSARDRAQGGPVTGDFAGLAPGELRTVAWRGKPVWLLRRSNEMVRALQEVNPALADPLSKRSEQPASCINATRSERPEYFVAIGVCTHLGCSPTLRLNDEALSAELHAPGGFLCPCHGSRFDLAGRVVKNVPAPTNLEVPNYRFISSTTVRIG
ncbi:ubiquinol-cytochrome c reductase iron-sulfur subunit [Variovorax sp. Sphag1AA]|uniref:ubiquinol-cytochrome c reductase iron-sulfur subunit n=1 Tax=Variovorax sp. Sphag1AA TaxID=2587027 RepID=UPI00161D93B5|nr:ubiquinol-cytochrome c reductase iron-sulfur subunit [Variovorax sp. Sphag1AA]MBB3181184.1 ubiquinol-cytochrome c reductase iron-sulfur subunit [Variovorax sp. Sphag1AA]